MWYTGTFGISSHNPDGLFPNKEGANNRGIFGDEMTLHATAIYVSANLTHVESGQCRVGQGVILKT